MREAVPLIAILVIVGIPFLIGIERLAVLLANRIMGHGGCKHMFPERGIGCDVCDQYYWETDARDMRVMDDRIARLEEATFPLEPSERIWIKETSK